MRRLKKVQNILVVWVTSPLAQTIFQFNDHYRLVSARYRKITSISIPAKWWGEGYSSNTYSPFPGFFYCCVLHDAIHQHQPLTSTTYVWILPFPIYLSIPVFFFPIHLLYFARAPQMVRPSLISSGVVLEDREQHTVCGTYTKTGQTITIQCMLPELYTSWMGCIIRGFSSVLLGGSTLSPPSLYVWKVTANSQYTKPIKKSVYSGPELAKRYSSAWEVED